MPRSLVAVLACLVVGLTSPQAMQGPASSPLAGTWKLNLSRSIYEGTSAPQSLTVSIEDRGDGLVVTRSEAVFPDGTANTTVSAFKCDGKDYPLVLRQGQSVPLSIACVARSVGTYELDLKHEDGQPIQKTVRTLAEDGRTMTDTVTALMADGQPVRVVAVLERQ